MGASQRCGRRLAAAMTCGLCAALFPASALADGGTSIAGATSVTPGQQEYGNTATGAQTPSQQDCADSDSIHYRSWWSLAVSAGDHVTIDWATQQYMGLFVLPEGTNDYTLGNVSSVVTQVPNSNGANQATYVVPQDGTLPWEFASDTGTCDASGAAADPGPYNFTAFIRHGVVLTLPPQPRKLPTAGTEIIRVHSPDGAPISDPSLTVTLTLVQRHPLTLGHAVVNAGAARIRYRVPARYAGKRVTIKATSQGAEYVNAATRSGTVSVLSRRAQR